MVDEAKLRSPIRSTSEALVVQSGSGTLVGRNWAPSADQRLLQPLQFSVRLIVTEHTSQM